MKPLVVRLRHRTLYRFETPVRFGPHAIRLRPAPFVRARLLDYALVIDPAPSSLRWIGDPASNWQARASFDVEADRLAIEVSLHLALDAVNPFDFMLDAEAAQWPFEDQAPLQAELAPYAERPVVHPWLALLLAGMDLSPQSPVQLLVALNQRVHDLVTYRERMEPGVQAPAQTLARASGSCRDVAWLLVLAARSLGFAARFVSGYLLQFAEDLDDGKPDRADLHAWAEMYLPGAGWVGFDATSGLITGAGHVALAAAADPAAASPVDGTTSVGQSRLETSLTLVRD